MASELEAEPKNHTVTVSDDFNEMLEGAKQFVVLPYDNDKTDGDTLTIVEGDPETNELSGRVINGLITYITSTRNHCAFSPEALKPDVCIVSFEITKDRIVK